MIPFTLAKYQAMQQQVDTLRTELAAVKIRLNEAREMGDLSENGAYKYAKFEIGRINRELRVLTDLLQRGEVVIAGKEVQGGFGSFVTLLDAVGKTVQYQLVSQYESDPTAGKLSLDSPIAQAIAGKKVGEIIQVPTPRGLLAYTIERWEWTMPMSYCAQLHNH